MGRKQENRWWVAALGWVAIKEGPKWGDGSRAKKGQGLKDPVEAGTGTYGKEEEDSRVTSRTQLANCGDDGSIDRKRKGARRSWFEGFGEGKVSVR